MHKNIVRNLQKGKARYEVLHDGRIKRFQDNATRLERVNVRNKNKSKKDN